MNDRDKLRALIPHWIEHNHEHASEYLNWAEKAAEASAEIKEAAAALDKVNWCLKQALDELGGPIDGLETIKHHHHHHHHH